MNTRKTNKRLFKKANDRLKQQSEDDLKKNVARFTLPSTEETTNVVTYSSEASVSWNTKKGKIWIGFFGMSIAMALIFGLLIYREGTIKSTPSPTSAEKLQVSPTPIQTPEALDVGKYKIEVLNGSGLPGEAAKAKDLLEEEKFTISSIGNADRLDFQKTVIQVKKTVPNEYLDKLKGFLEKSYILDDTKELNDSEEFDVIVIIGRDKVQF